jgi:hypothetical protein
MTDTAPAKPGFKQKAKAEFREYLVVSAYLAFFFCALVAYTMLLLRQYDVESDSMNFSFAIINALIIGKIILIGKMMKVGRGLEARPLYQTVIFKSFLYSLLVFVFHLIEEFVKRLIRGEPSGTVLHNMHPNELISRSIVVFCAFIPLFAFIELRRVVGEEEFYALFSKRGAATNPGLSTGN